MIIPDSLLSAIRSCGVFTVERYLKGVLAFVLNVGGSSICLREKESLKHWIHMNSGQSPVTRQPNP